ncbi:MAG: DUF362 domain-containing protein [bacterium]|nr:DUF362 domain-containing protein [bacterium]
MKKSITRRSFIKTGTALGASTLISTTALAHLTGDDAKEGTKPRNESVDLIALTGPTYYDHTLQAIEALGGIDRYVSKGDKIALNINAIRKHPGTIVHPDITLAVVGLCWQAGASEIYVPKPLAAGYWRRTSRMAEHQADIDRITFSERAFNRETREETGVEFVEVDLPQGERLKKAHVDRRFLDADVYINLPISKHHFGTNFTGSLKNMMAFTPYKPTNVFMHSPTGDPEAEDDFDHLSKCIADLNTLRTADLTVLAGIEFLTSNGPFGPGDIGRADTIVAGLDPVAIDAYATRFLERKPEEISMIRYAAERGIGSMNLSTMKIQTVTTETES